MIDIKSDSSIRPETPAPIPEERLAGAATWIFDLDNTLYPASCNLFAQVERNMTLFIMDRLGLDRDDAYAIQKTYFREHGTTMRGLMHHHGIDPHEFLGFVHDIDLSPIPENQELEVLLARLPGRKIIFTNGSVGHAERITRHMNIDHHFDAVFDIVAAGYVPKPERSVYELLLGLHDIDAASCVMVEDMAVNLKPAAELGMTTVWIETESSWGRAASDGDFIHHRSDDLTGWLESILERWEGSTPDPL